MKKLFFAALFAAFSLAVFGQTKIPKTAFEATFVKVNHDGDQAHFRVGQGKPFTVRFPCLEAPEVEKQNVIEKTQPHGPQSKQALIDIFKGTEGRVLIDTLQKRDRYNRIIGRVWLRSGEAWIDLTLYQIQNGNAWYIYNEKVPAKSRETYSIAHKIAKLQKVGLWDDETYADAPIDPRKWKRKHHSGFIFFKNRKGRFDE